jgi:Flp pilus assembly protein TadD
LFGRFQEAEEEFRASLRLDPSDPGIWSVLGLALAQQGRTAEGLQACRTALAIRPLPAAHFRMGWILAQQRATQEARAHFEAALALDPHFSDARRALQELPQ